MPYTMKTWSVVLFLFAVGLSMCFAHSSSYCKTQQLACPCSNGRSVRIKQRQCSVAGSCQPCKGRKPLACDQKKVASKCRRRLGELDTNNAKSPRITSFELEGNQEATLGATVNLTCRADDAPQAIIVFQKSGKILNEDQRITYFQQTFANDPDKMRTRVQIQNLTSADEGKYKCVVVSGNGLFQTKSLALKIHGKEASRKRRSLNHAFGCTEDGRVHVISNQTGPPKVTINGKLKIKFVDETIIITCTVKSNPPAHIRWLFNGAPLSQRQVKRYSIEFCNQSLNIASAETDDEGNFTCIATNENGTASESALVRVKVNIREPLINVFKLEGGRCTAYLGGSIAITCQAFHAYAIVFFNPSGRVHQEGRFTFSHPLVHDHVVETTLHIRNVSYEDAVNYTCAAVGVYGDITRRTMVLRVGPCPENHYCPRGGNQALRCPPGTCNDGEVPVVHQCNPCVAGTPSADQKPRAEFPMEVILLIVLCVILFLVLVITLTAYLHFHKRQSANLGRAESSSEKHFQLITNSKPPRL